MLSPLKSLLDAAAANHHRTFLVLTGSELWAKEQAAKLAQTFPSDNALWVGKEPDFSISHIPSSKATTWLGRECGQIFFDAFSGFDVDAFGVLSGTLSGGGLCVLLAPDLMSWEAFKDPEHKRLAVYPESPETVTGRYLSRLSLLIQEDASVALVSEQGESHWPEPERINLSVSDDVDPIYRTHEQAVAVEAIKRVSKGHRRRPLVLTADRGRGKSAALGIAAAQLMMEGVGSIHVTAPSLAAVETLFLHASLSLEGSKQSRGLLEWQDKQLRFYAPDEWLESKQGSSQCDLMLVDEAAALPVGILEQLLKDNSRIVFASTIHGYEGTGRGFAVKFRQKLDAVTPKWKALHIRQPVRWQAADPLEAFVFRALMLNASPAKDEEVAGVQFDQCEFVHFDRDLLMQDETLLQELFGLLVLAHYRTRPFDLRHLLDGPNIRVYGLKYRGRIVATLLGAVEGGLDPELEEPVWSGKRRVRGHLMPQSLSNHVGIPEAIALKGMRVIRIAVHPELQRQGLGQKFLEVVADHASDLDYLGSSFGATADLIQFWQSAGFLPVRTGLVREASSGCFSLMVLRPVSERAQVLQAEAIERFCDSLQLLLPDQLSSMEPELMVRLLRLASAGGSVRLSARDVMDLESFANGDRLYESCLVAIRKLLLASYPEAVIEDDELILLSMKVVQYRSWKALAVYTGVPGRKQVLQLFKERISKLLSLQSAYLE